MIRTQVIRRPLSELGKLSMSMGGILRVIPRRCAQLGLLPYAVYTAAIAALRTRDPRLSMTVYHLARLAMGGYYHDIPLADGYSTYVIGGRRVNRPYNLDNFPEVLWSLVVSELGSEFNGLNVVDIGPAEGFFTVKLASLGAKVTVIHPPHYFMDRLKYILRFHGLEKRVSVVTGWYPGVGLNEVEEADLVICLGLIYHLGDLIKGLQPLVNSRATLVVESTIYKENFPRDLRGHAIDFDPVRHQNNEPVCRFWLEEYLTANGYSVRWLDKWREFSELPGNARYKTKLGSNFDDIGDCITRGALIAGYHG